MAITIKILKTTFYLDVNYVFAKTLNKFNIEFTRLPIEELNAGLDHKRRSFYETVIKDSHSSSKKFEEFGLKYFFEI